MSQLTTDLPESVGLATPTRKRANRDSAVGQVIGEYATAAGQHQTIVASCMQAFGEQRRLQLTPVPAHFRGNECHAHG